MMWSICGRCIMEFYAILSQLVGAFNPTRKKYYRVTRKTTYKNEKSARSYFCRMTTYKRHQYFQKLPSPWKSSACPLPPFGLCPQSLVLEMLPLSVGCWSLAWLWQSPKSSKSKRQRSWVGHFQTKKTELSTWEASIHSQMGHRQTRSRLEALGITTVSPWESSYLWKIHIKDLGDPTQNTIWGE